MSPEEAAIREYMRTNLLVDFDDTVTPQSNLFQLGLIDSFGFIELVTFLETAFQIKFSDEDLLDGSLNTLAGIVSVVGRRTHA